MLATSITPLVLTTMFLSTTTLAAPTRTHCRCTIVSDTPSPPNTWTPSEPLIADPCFDLGPSLSHFRHHEPSLYASYIAPSLSPSNAHHQRPISSTVLRDLGRDGFYRSAQDHEHEPRPTARPQQRIECHSEPEPFAAYQGTFVNLWALQIIVAVAILACVAEGVHLVVRWLDRRSGSSSSSSSSDQDAMFPEERAVRLPGAEKRLLAIPPPVVYVDAVPSPGQEKKLRSYTTLRFFAVPQSASGRREFIAYEEDEDDEVNRPVM